MNYENIKQIARTAGLYAGIGILALSNLFCGGKQQLVKDANVEVWENRKTIENVLARNREDRQLFDMVERKDRVVDLCLREKGQRPVRRFEYHHFGTDVAGEYFHLVLTETGKVYSIDGVRNLYSDPAKDICSKVVFKETDMDEADFERFVSRKKRELKQETANTEKQMQDSIDQARKEMQDNIDQARKEMRRNLRGI